MTTNVIYEESVAPVKRVELRSNSTDSNYGISLTKGLVGDVRIDYRSADHGGNGSFRPGNDVQSCMFSTSLKDAREFCDALDNMLMRMESGA